MTLPTRNADGFMFNGIQYKTFGEAIAAREAARIPADTYMIPYLKQRMHSGELTPLDQTEVCISGRRYPSANWRGLNEWKPRERADLLEKIQDILTEYKKFLPLTARQIFYRLIGKFELPKSDELYNSVTKTLDAARRSERIPFDSIRDDGLTGADTPGWFSKKSFLESYKEAAEAFELKGHIDQPYRVELWCEAAGMVPQLEIVAHEYGVRVRSCGGFDSLSVKHGFVEEVLERARPTMVLQCGDLDPSGISILDAFASDVSQFVTDYEARGVEGPIRDAGKPAIEFRRVLVRPEQEAEYELVREDAPEKSTTSGAGICKETGKRYNPRLDYTIQAEAFAPDVLASLVRAAIEDVIDLDILAETKRRGAQIREELMEQFESGD